ncbi:hypothetical protein, partial [Enterococcus mundtii]|uniref:hypothetical protein n=1 Tax=Enterococcus mundtii TaxID=53346 RepID=UPI0035C1EE36
FNNKPKKSKMKKPCSIFLSYYSVLTAFSQPDKRCSKANSYDIKPKFEKIGEAIFSNYFLILGVAQLSHNLV